MYSLKYRLLHAMILPTVIMLAASCGSQHFYQGLNYQGSHGAPDTYLAMDANPETMQGTALPAAPETQGTVISPATEVQIESAGLSVEKNNLVEIEQAATIVREEARKMQEAGLEISHKNLSRQVSQQMITTGMMQQLTPAQERKMAKVAAKMDRKMKKQGKEIDWKHNSNLELFFMIMAIAGLVLGIVGVGFGWFIFIVFAGIWLYFKLVKD